MCEAGKKLGKQSGSGFFAKKEGVNKLKSRKKKESFEPIPLEGWEKKDK